MFNRNRFIKSIIARALIVVFAMSIFVAVDTPEAYAGTSVKIAHAAHGEKGTKGCKPGDQTGKEVCVRSWTYSSKSGSGLKWSAVFRCNDPKVAARIAKVAVKACKNPHVGYDKGTVKERQSFYKALEAANWNPSKITTDVETSCSPFVCACINAAYRMKYIKTDHSCTTLYKKLKSRPEFSCFTSSEFRKSDKYLKPGDILITVGHHTAIVVEQKAKVVDPPEVKEAAAASSAATSTSSTNASTASTKTTTKSTKKTTSKKTTKKTTAKKSTKSPFKAGTTYVLTTDLRFRTGPGTNYAIKKYSSLTSAQKKNAMNQVGKAVLKTGTKVKCLKTRGNWIKISGGWICGKEGNTAYIKKYNAKASKTAKASKAKKVKIKAGYDYRLTKALYVRKGPGENYDIKLRSSLSDSAKKYAMAGKKAMFKKGTVVTCLKKKGNWMKVPSGWIYCKAGNVTAVN